MSRVGKKPVPIPAGVQANLEGQTFTAKGPKGAMQLALHGDVCGSGFYVTFRARHLSS